MVKKLLWSLTIALSLLAGGAWADVWDVVTNTDNTAASTYNRLVHGTSQVHSWPDAAGPVTDQDWYRIYSEPRSSYEVVTDGYTADTIGVPTRYTADGSTTLTQGSGIGGSGYAYSLRWANTASSIAEERVLMSSSSTGNNSNDQYSIRMYETTIFLARFNNSGTQTTVLICQNPTNASITAYPYFWGGTGTLLNTPSAITIGAKATSVVSGVAGTTGQSGSVTVAHTGPYGSLNCKSVALEPSTGFSFDTPGVYRPQ